MSDRTHGPRYCRLAEVDPYDCVYCGEPAEHIDHVLPIAFVTKNRAPLTSEQRDQLVTVPACADCNMRAGSKVFKSLMQKRNWLRAHLYDKERHLLEGPMWTDEEIAALGHGLRGHVAGQQAKRALTLQRLAHDGLPQDWREFRNVDRDRLRWPQEPTAPTRWPPASSTVGAN